jgi:hypothetical protein
MTPVLLPEHRLSRYGYTQEAGKAYLKLIRAERHVLGHDLPHDRLEELFLATLTPGTLASRDQPITSTIGSFAYTKQVTERHEVDLVGMGMTVLWEPANVEVRFLLLSFSLTFRLYAETNSWWDWSAGNDG